MDNPPKIPLLAADLSEALFACLADDGQCLDGFKVGAWYSIEQIEAFRRRLPGRPFFFHAGNMIDEVGEVPGGAERLLAYLAAAGSPWLSVHLSVWDPGVLKRLYQGEAVPLPDPDAGLAVLSRRLERLARLCPVPLLVENIEPFPRQGYDYWARPEYIRRVIEASGCAFLLDTGHVRVAADHFGMDIAEYVNRLPLERVVEIHVSGPRRKAGRLWDAHASLQSADYRLLKSLLGRVQPQAVTLEYIRDRSALEDQLARLGRLIGRAEGRQA